MENLGVVVTVVLLAGVFVLFFAVFLKRMIRWNGPIKDEHMQTLFKNLPDSSELKTGGNSLDERIAKLSKKNRE
jgi:H+/Cl- antiporter ClcA